MASQWQFRPAPRERTFAQVFPWRNVLRALALVVLIFAIVMIKRSMRPMLERATQLWATPAHSPARPPGQAPRAAPGSRPAAPAADGFGVHLGPGLAPRSPRTDAP
jgi:hypothetical protein